MVARVNSFAFQGIEAVPVEVQVTITSGMPGFHVVGLADKAVTESRERVRSALHTMGLSLPPERITVNLAPADLQKEGSHFDLPIALALLSAMGAIEPAQLKGFAALGELSLDGSLHESAGILPAAIAANASGMGIICPLGNGGEAAFAGAELDIVAAGSLLALINHFKGTQLLARPEPKLHQITRKYPDLSEIKGQASAKRALEVAAAGGHNLLMIGPPGAGKSMLARCLTGILPPLSPEEILEVSIIRSISGQLGANGISELRPYRDPHHSCSMPALVGGGSKAKPGEITLAHHGVLFLDELPEFSRQTLDALRQPLENGAVTVARVQSHVTYPADFQLIAAMNPCRCGYFGDAARACAKVPKCAIDYQERLSGPLLDRIDIILEVAALSPLEIDVQEGGETSAQVALRVAKARKMQAERYQAVAGLRVNGRAGGPELELHAALDEKGKNLIMRAVTQMGLSMRAYHRILRVARTIADLAGAKWIEAAHVAEAVSYRHVHPRELMKNAV